MKRKNMKLSKIKKDNLKKKLGEKCVYCNCNNKFALTIDHKIPTARGGDDTEKNKQICCHICNQLKGALTHEEFKKYLKALDILYDLNKLFFGMDVPRVKIKFDGFPLTEEFIEKEIKKDQLKNGIKKGTQTQETQGSNSAGGKLGIDDNNSSLPETTHYVKQKGDAQ